jgi:hypothetical protein
MKDDFSPITSATLLLHYYYYYFSATATQLPIRSVDPVSGRCPPPSPLPWRCLVDPLGVDSGLEIGKGWERRIYHFISSFAGFNF